jgi:hypothetical protein
MCQEISFEFAKIQGKPVYAWCSLAQNADCKADNPD